MTANNGPAALTRPGPDTEGISSMHEPTYTVPRHLLYGVQAAMDTISTRRRKLQDAVRDGDHAIDAAVQAGATEPELVAYGVPPAVARAALEHAEGELRD